MGDETAGGYPAAAGNIEHGGMPHHHRRTRRGVDLIQPVGGRSDHVQLAPVRRQTRRRTLAHITEIIATELARHALVEIHLEQPADPTGRD